MFSVEFKSSSQTLENGDTCLSDNVKISQVLEDGTSRLCGGVASINLTYNYAGMTQGSMVVLSKEAMKNAHLLNMDWVEAFKKDFPGVTVSHQP